MLLGIRRGNGSPVRPRNTSGFFPAYTTSLDSGVVCVDAPGVIGKAGVPTRTHEVGNQPTIYLKGCRDLILPRIGRG